MRVCLNIPRQTEAESKTKMKLNPENGSITLPDGNLITVHTALADLAALYPQARSFVPYAGTTHFGLSFADTVQQYAVAACFRQERLDSVSVFFCPTGEDNSWEAWTEAHELQRRQEFDRWLDKQLGSAPCTVQTSAAGKCRRFAWGSAGAYYHKQDGGTAIVVRYAEPFSNSPGL
jgi:hypothetical protein